MNPGILLDAIRGVAHRVLTDEHPEPLLADVLNGLSTLLQCPVTAVWVFDRDIQRLDLLGAYPSLAVLGEYVADPGHGLVGKAFQQQDTQTVEAGEWSSADAALDALAFCAGVAVPLLWRGATVGVLAGLDSAPDRTFDPRDTDLAELVGQYMAAIVANDRLQHLTSETTSTLEVERGRLADLQAAVRRVLEQPDVNLNLIEIAEAFQALGWQQVIVAVYAADESIDQLITLGVPEERREALHNGIVQVVVQQLYEQGKLEQYRLGALYFIPATRPGTKWHPDDLLFAPLRLAKGRTVGVIRLGEPANSLRPTPEALRVLDVLASQAAFLIENMRLLDEKTRTADELAEQVEELSMIHRADRELSSHLNMDQVMTLTMDWALRRTGADTGLLALMTADQRGLVPFTTMGYLGPDILASTEQNPWPLDRGILGQAVSSSKTQIADELEPDDEDALMPGARSQISVPLSMRGEVLGVLSLMSTETGVFDEKNASFLERLARRAAVALDNARLFRQSEQLADDMAVLYSASRAITATLERDEVLQRIAQSIAVALESSSAIILNYHVNLAEAEVLASYRVGTARGAAEVLPEVKTSLSLKRYTAVSEAIEQHRPLVLRTADTSLPDAERQWLDEARIRAMMLLPLIAQDELIGLAMIIEGRRDRIFTQNEVFKGETLASQASVALRQSMLYNEVLQLEQIKSEMIRMASHDLRNPLNNIMGYLELLAMSIDQADIAPDLKDYMGHLRRSARTMQSLIDDLLTLERVESERESEWQAFDFSGLVLEVVEAQQSSADLKRQSLTFERPENTPAVFGSVTQLRQAVTNLVGNAIKYTPDEGTIEVRLGVDDNRLQFSVKDNGYGISPERQRRMFERFYRAREPGTETISGTGLGLSLVKTVVERHGGLVWFESERGVGSTFGCWLPAASTRNHPSGQITLPE